MTYVLGRDHQAAQISRGKDWRFYPRFARGAERVWSYPDLLYLYQGFRVCVEVR